MSLYKQIALQMGAKELIETVNNEDYPQELVNVCKMEIRERCDRMAESWEEYQSEMEEKIRRHRDQESAQNVQKNKTSPE
jgi:hypothetical protein